MTTVSEVLAHLKREGYTADFNLAARHLACAGSAVELHPTEFVVDKHYRFEGLSDPGDEAVVYAISSARHGLKGTLVNGYGIYSEALADELFGDLLVGECGGELLVQAREDRRWRAGGCDDAGPGGRFEAGQRLGHRWRLR